MLGLHRAATNSRYSSTRGSPRRTGTRSPGSADRTRHGVQTIGAPRRGTPPFFAATRRRLRDRHTHNRRSPRTRPRAPRKRSPARSRHTPCGCPSRSTRAGRRTGGRPPPHRPARCSPARSPPPPRHRAPWPAARTPPRCPTAARCSASISARRGPAYWHTYEYDTGTPCSSASRCQIRREVCRCLRGASRSSRSIASISPATASSTGETRSGVLRGAGTGRPAPPAPSAGAPRACAPAPAPLNPAAGDPPGSWRTTPPCPVPSAPPQAGTTECDQLFTQTHRLARNLPGVSPPGNPGGARSECYHPAALTPGWGQIKEEQWGHLRVLRPR